MRKFLFSVLFLLLLAYIGPGYCATADDDRYKRPDIDIVDFEEPDTIKEEDLVPEIAEELIEEDITPKIESKPSKQNKDTVKETPSSEPLEQKADKNKESALEAQQEAANAQAKDARETAKPDQDKAPKADIEQKLDSPPTAINDEKQKVQKGDPAKSVEEIAQNSLKTEEAQVPANDKSNKQDQEKTDKPVDAIPRQPTATDAKGQPTQAPSSPQGQPQGQQGQRGATVPPTNQGARPAQNPSRPPQGVQQGQQGQPGPQIQANQQRAPMNSGRPINQAPQLEQPVPQAEVVKPTSQSNQDQNEIVREAVEKVEAPQAQEKVTERKNVDEQRAPQETNSAPQNQQTEVPKPNKDRAQPDDLITEEEYMRLVGGTSYGPYIDQYKTFSESFYSHVEHLTKEVLLPFYKQIRSNDYLSLGLSSLVILYFIILFFRVLASLFRKKPKFRYNKEETVSYSDINNNFKRFLTEVDNLKKQMETNAKKGLNASQVSQGGEMGAVNVSIPQSLQDEINYIAQNLSRNDDLLNKVTKDKRQLDSFLVEFQKEVVESHKAIWNELYQLRKLFSLGKLNVSTSSLKSKAETRDFDDTKSLSSNPETNNEVKRRDDQRLVATTKISSEPRSKSVATSENSGLRSRKLAPPTEKRAQDVPPRKPSLVQNGDTNETHASEASQNKEEEPQREVHVNAPLPEKTPFRKLSRDEDIQPTIQIPTADKGPLNPFANNAQNTPNQTNAGTNANPTFNANAKSHPFGAGPRKLSTKLPGRPSSIQDLDQNVNALGKTDANSDMNNSRDLRSAASGLGLMASAQNSMTNNPEASNLEQSQDKSEGRILPPGSETNLEEARPSDQLLQTDESQAAVNEETEASSEPSNTSKAFVPPMRPGPMIGMNAAGMRGKQGVPTNKALPVPGVRRPGPPGANVFKGPPGNLPRPGGPAPIKQPQGQVPDGTPKNNSQV